MQNLINKYSAIVVFLFLTVFNVFADDSHYVNSNVGDRASGMAGAYTAVSDDTSGCYYNPAGIVLAPANKFSASANAINTSTKIYKDVLEDTSGNTLDWKHKSFSLLPNYFGIVQKIGQGMFGFSYAVPESVQMRQKQTFSDIQGAHIIDKFTINLNNTDKTYLFGPSYAYRISEGLSAGATLYYYYRDTEIITNQFIQFSSGADVIANQYSSRTDNGIKPILGVIWDPVDNISIGFTFSKLFLINGDSEVQLIQNNDTDPAEFSFFNATNTDKDKYPLSVSLGVAWFCTPALLYSCDIKYAHDVEDKDSVINIAVGTEYYTSDHFAVRAGFYTDISNAPVVTTSVLSDTDHIDIYGLTLSGTLFSGKTSVSLGMDYRFGKGESQVFSENQTVFDVEYTDMTVHISSSFSY